MVADIIGREYEKGILSDCFLSSKSEFIAVYGRRRVGKTFLINNVFQHIDFYYTAILNASAKEQLFNWGNEIRYQGLDGAQSPKDWMQAFNLLKQLLLQSNNSDKKIIFLDELPWMDKGHGGFIKALEYFWNSWAANRNNILLIVCGSATSWIMDKIINNHGGLHNRVNQHIYLQPFTLNEVEKFLIKNHFQWNRFMIAECYMIMGGIPYYLSLLNPKMSLSQNIDQLFFKKYAPLRNEFSNLYASIFKNSDHYISVVEALGQKTKGLTREEIIKETLLPDGGNLTTILNNLEYCGFIQSYYPFEKKKKNKLFKLVDFYTLFYFKFIKDKGFYDNDFWSKSANLSIHNTCAGLTFEQLCLAHIDKIKKTLGISGIISNNYTWRSKNADQNAQIDLVIDRSDQAITVCEMKYSINEFTIDKEYDRNLRNKIAVFQQDTKTRKSIFLSLVSTFGLKKNMYSDIVHNVVVLDDLFS